MIISMFNQAMMIGFGLPAIYLVVKYDGWRESIGIVLGSVSAAFMILSALKGGQWGILVLCGGFYLFTYPRLIKFVTSWCKGKFKKDKKEEKTV